jgi:hypothetical protein
MAGVDAESWRVWTSSYTVAVLPRTQSHQAKPRIMIPNAPTTTPQKAGLHHGGTFIRHLLSLFLALQTTALLKTFYMILYGANAYDG